MAQELEVGLSPSINTWKVPPLVIPFFPINGLCSLAISFDFQQKPG